MENHYLNQRGKLIITVRECSLFFHPNVYQNPLTRWNVLLISHWIQLSWQLNQMYIKTRRWTDICAQWAATSSTSGHQCGRGVWSTLITTVMAWPSDGGDTHTTLRHHLAILSRSLIYCWIYYSDIRLSYFYRWEENRMWCRTIWR